MKDACNSLWGQRAKHAPAPFILTSLAGAIVLMAGLMAAYIPELAIRMALLALLPIVFLAAMLNRGHTAVSLQFRIGWVTLLLAVFALWPSYLLIKVGGVPALDLRRVAAGISLLIGLYYLIAGKAVATSGSTSGAGPIRVGYWLVATYATWRFMTCTASSVPIASVIHVFWEVLYYYSFFFLGHLFFSTDALRDRVHKVILWLILIVAAYACVERVLGANPMVRWAPSNEEFETTVRAMNLSRLRDGAFRTQGTFEHPLLLSEFAAFSACFSLAAVLWSRKTRNLRSLGTASMIASVTAAYLSGSRSAFVALGAGLMVVTILRLVSPTGTTSASKAGMRKLVAIGLLALGAALATPAIMVLSQGKNTGEAASTEARVVTLGIGLSALNSQPILGWGPGNGPAIAGIKTGEGLATMDNYLLSIAIESGVPGICLFIACLLYPAWAAFTLLARGAEDRASFLGAVAGAAVAELAMRSILWMPFNLSFVFLVAGIALAQCSVRDRILAK